MYGDVVLYEHPGSIPGKRYSSMVSQPSDSTAAPQLHIEKTPRLVMFEFHQNDPKKDTGMRLVKRGAAKALKPHVPFQVMSYRNR